MARKAFTADMSDGKRLPEQRVWLAAGPSSTATHAAANWFATTRLAYCMYLVVILQ